MKVCSLYGAGYYYMPGTDICLKVGGYVRFQTSFGTNQQTRPALIGGNATNANGAGYGWRTRAVMTLDSRQQTAYGTLRTYFLIGFQQDNSDPIGTVAAAPGTATGLYATRGFIQIAGFTFGKATSFFDHFPTAGRAYFAGNFHNSSTGDGGWNVAAYTAQFGNGVSATIALEEVRGRHVLQSPVAAYAVIPAAANHARYGALRGHPDIVANLRVDQAWGSVMIGGALHDASVSYYGAVPGAASPGNKMGWALTAATELNVPFLAPGSKFNAQFIYARGASQYASHTSAGGGFDTGATSNNTRAWGFLTDGIYGAAGSSIELTTAWSLAVAYQHQWTPNLNTSFYGSYLDVSHSQTAKNYVLAATGLAVADPDWSAWNLGARTEWQPIRGLTLGVDVVYNKIKSATFRNAAGDTGVANPFTGANYRTGDRDSFAGMFRVQRNFLP